MSQQLSDMIDTALRQVRAQGEPDEQLIELVWPVLVDLLKEIGIFARDMERTAVLHGGAHDAVRRLLEQSTAADRFYGRLLDPPHAANLAPFAPRGAAALVVVEASHER